jgi:hypothetical protein
MTHAEVGLECSGNPARSMDAIATNSLQSLLYTLPLG